MSKKEKIIFCILSVIIAFVESYFIIVKFESQVWKWFLLGLCVFMIYQIILNIYAIFRYKKDEYHEKQIDLSDINFWLIYSFPVGVIIIGLITGERSILNLLVGAVVGWVCTQLAPRCMNSKYNRDGYFTSSSSSLSQNQNTHNEEKNKYADIFSSKSTVDDISYSKKDNFGSTVYYNNNGTVNDEIAFSKEGNFGETRYYGKDGTVKGTSREDNFGNTIYRKE